MNKIFGSIIVLCAALVVWFILKQPQPDLKLGGRRTSNQVYFVPNYSNDPNKDVVKIVVAEINKAQKRILVQAYEFTSRAIADALIEAKKRKVDVRVIIDKKAGESQYSVIKLLKENGITCYGDSHHRIAHNKVIVIDEAVVLTGSYNWTEAAQKHNAENMLVIHEAGLIQAYILNWNEHKEHSKEID
jgi:phosphatidylserine/phosphatidylglycerophosphate/cardiolipin synthase-like enzyme